MRSTLYHHLARSHAQQERRNAEAALAHVRWTDPGRELRATLPDDRWPRIVVCLSIWWDAAALKDTAPTWARQVDAVVVADGPWIGVGEGPSPDELDAVLDTLPCAVHRVAWDQVAWPDQRQKRTAIVREASRLYPDALLVILDADESVTGDLRASPVGDVLWCDVTSPLYERPYSQPRGVKADPTLRYAGRHHWLYRGDDLLATHQYGGLALHRRMPVSLHNARGLGHSPARKEAKRRAQRAQASETEATTGRQSDTATGARESLRVAQLTCYDAGLVCYRLHTALNTTTPHVSVLGGLQKKRAFDAPMQYAIEDHDERVRLGHLAEAADVIHCHLDYSQLLRLGLTPHWLVIHHHGTMLRKAPDVNAAMDQLHGAGLRLVSNLELLQYGDGLRFLPNPVPVMEYRRLVSPGPGFRIAHSPSKRHLKGTDAFLRACDRVNAKGLRVEPVLLEGLPHADALRMKATCHAAFDAFWLGLQCSGLEAGAMGLPVIAGDVDCKRGYEDWLGEVPYTWANDEDGLVEAIERLATDADFYAGEAGRVSQYVATHHDEAAVALRYLDLLDEAFEWRLNLSLGNRKARARVA